MKKPVLAVFFFLLGVSAGFGEEPHWKDGKQPTCKSSKSPSGQSIRSVCGAGEAVVGYGDITYGVEATAEGVPTCQDKTNKEFALPGAYPTKAKFSQLVTVPASDTRNGEYRFPLIQPIFGLRTPNAEEAGCPNGKDYTTILNLVKWDIKYVVYQPYPNVISKLTITLPDAEVPQHFTGPSVKPTINSQGQGQRQGESK